MSKWKDPKTDYTAGSPVTANIFNEMAENEIYLKESKITTDEVQQAVIASEQNTVRQNLTDKDTIMGAFGKIRKWFIDLKALAFKDKIENADIVNVDATKINGLNSVAISGSYNELTNKPSITKNAIGLNNVANERQYSENNVPPYPVQSVNGMTGAVVLPSIDVSKFVQKSGDNMSGNLTVGGIFTCKEIRIN